MERISARLPTRIVFFVFAVTLITSLTVAGVSVRSTSEFLREKIEHQVATILDEADAEIVDWYDQRVDEMQVFTASEVLTRGLPSALEARSETRRTRAKNEVHQYLQYLLDDFPHYGALFVLTEDTAEPIAVSVGQAPELPTDWLDDLRSTEATNVSPIAQWSGALLQIASAPIVAADGRQIGTLHATIRVSHLSGVLERLATHESATLVIVDEDALILASSRTGRAGQRFTGSLAASPAGRVELDDYENEAGDSLVGGARALGRFDWTLVHEEPYGDAFAPIVAAISRVTIINLGIVLVVCIAAFRIAVSIVRPIEALSDAARRIADGERDVEIPAQEGEDEVAVLSRVLRGMTLMLTRNAAELEQSHAAIEEANSSLQQKNEELQEMNEILEQLSITDGLTKLHNHRYFQEALASECKRADRTGEPLALILIDIDEFKKWNDRLGHAGGDEILRKMAQLLNDGVRETDLLARYGGEEFALLAPDTHLLGAAKLAEKLRNDVAESRFISDGPHQNDQVTVSLGVAIYDGDLKRLFIEADRALYRAKDAGRDCVMVAEHDAADADQQET